MLSALHAPITSQASGMKILLLLLLLLLLLFLLILHRGKDVFRTTSSGIC